MVPKRIRQAHNRTHGETNKTVENKCWKHIKEVSRNRNIPFDDEWNNYESFLNDMGRRPSSKHKLRRLDKNKGFCKDNCRWMTKEEHSEYYNNIRIEKGKDWEWEWEYRSWITMIARCTDPNKDNYYQYGGAGITVSERWLGNIGFKNFCSDMGHRPSIKHTLHRVKNELGYSPENCIWLKTKGQAIHRRSSRFIRYKDYNFNMSTWAEILDINYGTFKRYIYKGMTIEEILVKPIKGKLPRDPQEYLEQHNNRIAELYPEMNDE